MTEEPPIAPDPVSIPGQDPIGPAPGSDPPDPAAPPELEPGPPPMEMPDVKG
ncbi:MAG TPA: hypothetical protein VMU59_10170 [Caulobacteraceae bacterium]|nr:hypothetical protein [Caulobacteraceae bacterium]